MWLSRVQCDVAVRLLLVSMSVYPAMHVTYFNRVILEKGNSYIVDMIGDYR